MSNTLDLYEDIIFFFLIFFIIVINLLEMVLLLKKRGKLSNYEALLLSLSATDLLIGVTKGFIHIIWLLNVFSEYIALPMLWFSLAGSLAHTISITLDRLLAVAYPLKHRILSTRRNITVVLIGAWSFGFVILLLVYILPRGGAKFVLAITMYITSLSMLTSYGFIIHKSVIKRRKFTSNPSNLSFQQQAVSTKRELNLVCVCFLITTTFIAFMLPYSYYAVVQKEPSAAAKIALICNSLANPLIYFFWKYKDRRSKAKKTSSTPDDQQKISKNSTTN